MSGGDLEQGSRSSPRAENDPDVRQHILLPRLRWQLFIAREIPLVICGITGAVLWVSLERDNVRCIRVKIHEAIIALD